MRRFISSEIAEKTFMNPLNPPVLGDLFISGGHPQVLGRKNSAPLFRQPISVRLFEGALAPSRKELPFPLEKGREQGDRINIDYSTYSPKCAKLGQNLRQSHGTKNSYRK
jgi:hypothetical protein